MICYPNFNGRLGAISPFQVTSLPRDVTSAGHDWVQPGPHISPTSMGKQCPLVVREF